MSLALRPALEEVTTEFPVGCPIRKSCSGSKCTKRPWVVSSLLGLSQKRAWKKTPRKVIRLRQGQEGGASLGEVWKRLPKVWKRLHGFSAM